MQRNDMDAPYYDWQGEVTVSKKNFDKMLEAVFLCEMINKNINT